MLQWRPVSGRRAHTHTHTHSDIRVRSTNWLPAFYQAPQHCLTVTLRWRCLHLSAVSLSKSHGHYTRPGTIHAHADCICLRNVQDTTQHHVLRVCRPVCTASRSLRSQALRVRSAAAVDQVSHPVAARGRLLHVTPNRLPVTTQSAVCPPFSMTLLPTQCLAAENL